MNKDNAIYEQDPLELYADIIEKLIFLAIGLYLTYIVQDFSISIVQYKQEFNIYYVLYLLMGSIAIILSLTKSVIKNKNFFELKIFKRLVLFSAFLFLLSLTMIYTKLGDLTLTFFKYNLTYYLIILISGSCMAISFELETRFRGIIQGLLRKPAFIALQFLKTNLKTK